MIAACLAYIWITYLGQEAVRKGWDKIFHRKSRCDLSMFQIGLNAFDHLLNEGVPIPAAFKFGTRAYKANFHDSPGKKCPVVNV